MQPDPLQHPRDELDRTLDKSDRESVVYSNWETKDPRSKKHSCSKRSHPNERDEDTDSQSSGKGPSPSHTNECPHRSLEALDAAITLRIPAGCESERQPPNCASEYSTNRDR